MRVITQRRAWAFTACDTESMHRRAYLYDDGNAEPAVAHLNGSRTRALTRMERSPFSRVDDARGGEGGEELDAATLATSKAQASLEH